MTILQTAVVSRKTPRDGKLEITAESASRLGGAGATLTVKVGDVESPGTVSSMPCACKEASHTVHVFVQAEVFQTLMPNSSVSLSLESGNRLLVSPQSPQL